MYNLVNKLREWSNGVRSDAQVTEEEGFAPSGTEMAGLVKGQRVCTNEVNQILDEYECSCQEQ